MGLDQFVYRISRPTDEDISDLLNNQQDINWPCYKDLQLISDTNKSEYPQEFSNLYRSVDITNQYYNLPLVLRHQYGVEMDETFVLFTETYHDDKSADFVLTSGIKSYKVTLSPSDDKYIISKSTTYNVVDIEEMTWWCKNHWIRHWIWESKLYGPDDNCKHKIISKYLLESLIIDLKSLYVRKPGYDDKFDLEYDFIEFPSNAVINGHIEELLEVVNTTNFDEQLITYYESW